MRFDKIWRDARHCDAFAAAATGLGEIEPGAVAAKDGRIAFVGPERDLPTGWDAAETVKLDGRWITPGLIDCHTHLVYGGDRAHEFELRLKGASYEEIARAGGGIVSTVKATRAASEDDLVAQSLPRLDALLAEGVTTIEIKSGYGLDLVTETKMLRAARRLGRERKVDVVDDLSRRACACRRKQARQGRLHRQGLRHDPADQAGGPCGRGRRILRGHRLFARAGRARVRCGEGAAACR